MRRIVVVLSMLALVASAVIQERVPGAIASSPGKKVCKTIKKKGKKQKVCHTVKAKPTAKPRPTATSTPLAPGDMAQKLANDLAAASADDARYSALLNVFKAIHVGVYNGQTGDPIVPGMETNKNDVYFYDAEVQELATAFGRKQVYTFNDLARLLTSLGISPVDGTTLGTLAQGLAKWGTQNPTQPAALVPALVRDLGQKHDTAYDLATVAHPETVALDTLQLELLALYFLAPIQHAASQPKTAFTDHARAHYGICTAIKVALNPFNPNTYLPDSAQLSMIVDGLFGAVVPSAVGVFIKELAAFSGKWGDQISLAATIANALHGLLLAYGLTVDSGPTGGVLSTHYGPAGHAPDAGKKLQFQARVIMQDKIPDWLRTCLHDAGYDIPDQGPVPDVGISWDEGGLFGIGANHLDDYGTVTQDPASAKTGNGNTGPKGVETMNFTPKDETIPGVGHPETVTGEETPRALWGMAFTNPLGTVSQLFFPMLGPELDWAVTYHKANGYKFTLSVSSNTMQPGADQGPGVAGGCTGSDCVGQYLSFKVDRVIQGRICGSDPYGAWDIHTQETQTYNTSLKGLVAHTSDDHVQWTLQKTGAFTWGPGATAAHTPATFLLGPPPQVTYSDHVGGGFWTTSGITGVATISEDTSCPDTK